MKAKKIAIIVGAIIALGVIVGFTVNQTQKNVVAVQTGKVMRQDIASTVTASGEIKPKNFVNVGANAMGRITHLYVKEGDHVKKDQLLATLENVQSTADVDQMKAGVAASETDAIAAEAALKTAIAQSNSSKVSAAQAKQDADRAESLYKNDLIAKQDYEAKKSAADVQTAMAAHDVAQVAQARATLDSAQGHVKSARAQLLHFTDVLSKTVFTAPYAGVVTNVPVHEGETVVPGIQNSPGSTLMTVSDMSVITAEVQVDETDIVNVKLGQNAEVTIDAIPNQTFPGTVTEIGDNAIVRSTGISTAQTTASNQEAKDFKVVVTLTKPPDNLRPGLSTTAKITTGSEKGVLTIPIQALTIRDKKDLDAPDKSKSAAAKPAATPAPGAKKEAEELQGVFVITKTKKAEFHTVETGLTGSTDIQVKSGLQEGDEIITGSYKVLKTLRNGAGVKVDNSIAAKSES